MPAPILLYDGDCGFCAESVQLVLRYDRRRTLRFAALQGSFGTSVRLRHPELSTIDSMFWVEPIDGGSERVLARSAAALRLARYLGGIWRVLLLGYLLPAAIRDGLYDFIARHRHRLGGKGDGCLVVPPEVRTRFLD